MFVKPASIAFSTSAKLASVWPADTVTLSFLASLINSTEPSISGAKEINLTLLSDNLTYSFNSSTLGFLIKASF